MRPDGGGSGITTRVETSKLNQASNNLAELRGDTDNADRASQQDTLDAVAGLNRGAPGSGPGGGAFETAIGLFDMDTRWQQQVINLKGLLQSINEKIHETQGNYSRREEHESSAHHSAITRDFG
ncbi:hypothetical protein [Streptomyces cavernicola]|uniref:WXG100 family type VII secretion target n=1 Tax=Streptomyces cavernicola TaxID=3043613 RepID=A0ABT6SHK0_9ACTN|nr:hypothetical protein [Streptomyces sp. B-S-A6]MDI3407364.1 hypothetical protein [Streptomyces sp. B-S-A6]